jgi:hypothetical protein
MLSAPAFPRKLRRSAERRNAELPYRRLGGQRVLRGVGLAYKPASRRRRGPGAFDCVSVVRAYGRVPDWSRADRWQDGNATTLRRRLSQKRRLSAGFLRFGIGRGRSWSGRLWQGLQNSRLAQGGVSGPESGADRTAHPATVPAFLILGGDRIAHATEVIVVVDVGVARADRVPRMNLTHGLRYAFDSRLVVTPNTFSGPDVAVISCGLRSFRPFRRFRSF